MNAPYQGLPGLSCLDCYRTLVNKYLFSTYWHQKPPMIQKMKTISLLHKKYQYYIPSMLILKCLP